MIVNVFVEQMLVKFAVTITTVTKSLKSYGKKL
jgi:hypothetical protein